METDDNSSDNSSGALGAGEHAGGSHQLQSPGSAREPLVEISTSKSDCTKNCNRSNCGFLFDDRLNYAEPPKSANFAVSTRTHMGGTKQDP